MTLHVRKDGPPAWVPPEPLSPESCHLMFIKIRAELGMPLTPEDEALWKNKQAYDRWIRDGGGRALDEDLKAI